MSPITEGNVNANAFTGSHHGSDPGIRNRGDGRLSFVNSDKRPFSQAGSMESNAPGTQLKENSNLGSIRNGVFHSLVDMSNLSKHKMEFFHKEECLYSHEMFLKAGKIYDSLKHEETDVKKTEHTEDNEEGGFNSLAQLDFENENEKRLTFELAFSTLKYQSLFEDIVYETSFYNHYPELQEDEGIVMVVLYDYQNRRFQYRVPFPDEELNEIVTKVETAINDMKTKLAAAIARHRIKASARSLEFLLPESVRHSDEAKSKMPAYFWINQLRTSTEDVMDLLRVEGFKIVNSVRELGDDGDKFYCFDHHCPDLLVVASHQVKSLQESDIVNDGLIVRQDKSSCLAPHTVKYLLNEDDDVIHVNAGFGLTSGHIASLLKPSKSHIFAFGATGDADVYRIHKNLGRLGVGKCVRVISEPFLNIEPDDSRYKSVRIVLVTADCTKSAVTNPVEFVVSEGEDMTILKDLSVGDKDAMKINQLNNEHSRILKHAMRFSKVQAVVYMTRSVHEAENEMVVEKTVEYVNSIQQKKMPFRLVPPVLAFSADEIENNRGICGKYMKFKPSNTMNGCFVAVITREPEDLKDSAKDAIARANAKGLLGAKSKKGHDSDNHHGHHIKSKKSRKKLRASASAGFKPNMTISSNRMQMYQKSSGLKQVISAARKRDQDDKTKHLSLPRFLKNAKNSKASKLSPIPSAGIARSPSPRLPRSPVSSPMLPSTPAPSPKLPSSRASSATRLRSTKSETLSLPSANLEGGNSLQVSSDSQLLTPPREVRQRGLSREDVTLDGKDVHSNES